MAGLSRCLEWCRRLGGQPAPLAFQTVRSRVGVSATAWPTSIAWDGVIATHPASTSTPSSERSPMLHITYVGLIILGVGIGMAIGILMGIEIQRAREEGP